MLSVWPFSKENNGCSCAHSPEQGDMTGYLYIALTILFTVYGQIILKWQVSQAGILPVTLGDKIGFFLGLLLNPWIASAFLAAFLASLCWMAAMTKLPLSHAYPFMSLAFVLVMFLSAFIFHEPLSWPKVIGMVGIVAGIVIGSQG